MSREYVVCHEHPSDMDTIEYVAAGSNLAYVVHNGIVYSTDRHSMGQLDTIYWDHRGLQ